ncbi:MAG TPA: zinc ribbon domain-containing protein [Firmicutes bacterium]|uniref:Zinc ribbon domain-containing protein n=1 Tax=Candidatus Fermentithermobacillus carboniphilus TaxID=3085328 RepID=A0AAT9LAC3_9FIRM|nr:MAG: zinc ribbon domain-containing protein [Candidatus Fermentithermobacillus carboniphilus]HHW18846.1 zinc ribbon domain-containing protein [Candidatus Fermentithermobacillaceae bacterium]
MPIYEYKCAKCGVFETMQKITDEPLKTCPKCGGPVTKLISHNVGIIFKGTGFYTTDNRSNEYKEKAKEDKGESKAADT